MGNRTPLVLLLPVLAGVVGIAVAATSAHTAVWKANPAKSSPGIKSMVEMVVVDGEKYNIDGAGEDIDGKWFQFRIRTRFDGKDYPIEGIAWADAAQARWGNGHKLQLIEKKDGNVVGVVTCEVSADGKTRTCTLARKDDQGKSVQSVVVFERQ